MDENPSPARRPSQENSIPGMDAGCCAGWQGQAAKIRQAVGAEATQAAIFGREETGSSVDSIFSTSRTVKCCLPWLPK